MAFSTFTVLHKHHRCLALEHFHHPKRNPCPWGVISHYPLPQVPGSHQSASCLCGLPFLESSYWESSSKWYHIICGFWYLASFTYPSVFKFHLCCSRNKYFIPFYGWIFPCKDILILLIQVLAIVTSDVHFVQVFEHLFLNYFEWKCSVIWQSYVYLIKEPPNCLGCHISLCKCFFRESLK